MIMLGWWCCVAVDIFIVVVDVDVIVVDVVVVAREERGKEGQGGPIGGTCSSEIVSGVVRRGRCSNHLKFRARNNVVLIIPDKCAYK